MAERCRHTRAVGSRTVRCASTAEYSGFEVLLKCALLLSGATVPKNHDYAALWRRLPAAAQSEIMETARTRSPVHADLSDLYRLFTAYREYFESGRYYYELYVSAEQEHEEGQRWLERGARAQEARMPLYPEELFCLTGGLRGFIEARL